MGGGGGGVVCAYGIVWGFLWGGMVIFCKDFFPPTYAYKRFSCVLVLKLPEGQLEIKFIICVVIHLLGK